MVIATVLACVAASTSLIDEHVKLLATHTFGWHVFQRFLAEDVADCKMRAILISPTVKTVKNHKGIYLWRWENHKQTMRTTSKA